MGRSLKKGPFIDEKLMSRIDELNRTRQKKVLKTWARRSTISPECVGDALRVHHAIADGGPSLKRVQPRAMGRAFFIKHRTSHLSVGVSDEAAIAQPPAPPRHMRRGPRPIAAPQPAVPPKAESKTEKAEAKAPAKKAPAARKRTPAKRKGSK